jgi:hypothetical protein
VLKYFGGNCDILDYRGPPLPELDPCIRTRPAIPHKPPCREREGVGWETKKEVSRTHGETERLNQGRD